MASCKLSVCVILLAGYAPGCAPSSSKNTKDPFAEKSISQPAVPDHATATADKDNIPRKMAVDDNIQLLDMSFGEIQALIKSKKGSVAVVEMWATWCPPCVKEFPNLVKLQSQHDVKDLVCISVSFDFQGIDPVDETHETVTAFLHRNNATILNILSTEDSDILSKRFGITSIPVVDVYDRSGALVERFAEATRMPVDYEEIAKLVAKLIVEK